jgi:hypothetical protein
MRIARIKAELYCELAAVRSPDPPRHLFANQRGFADLHHAQRVRRRRRGVSSPASLAPG